ncbi:hypothetical protein T05_6330 [Trichinella murrelli]|uniref:Secreted protein n=1 Tax=Trichinella murrelli TaxID=144512 RepID=A0A0V0TPK8_9BILA|nr:hypothetical protein T05_6330 [Trichinella murrelli]
MWREIDGLRLLLVLVKQAIALCTISKRSTDQDCNAQPCSTLISSYHTTLSMHTLNALFARIQACFYRAQESQSHSLRWTGPNSTYRRHMLPVNYQQVLMDSNEPTAALIASSSVSHPRIK